MNFKFKFPATSKYTDGKQPNIFYNLQLLSRHLMIAKSMKRIVMLYFWKDIILISGRMAIPKYCIWYSLYWKRVYIICAKVGSENFAWYSHHVALDDNRNVGQLFCSFATTPSSSSVFFQIQFSMYFGITIKLANWWTTVHCNP